MKDNSSYIPFNRPFFSESGFDYIRQAIDNCQLSGDGVFTQKCHALIEQELGVPKVLLTTSCTHALEMAALLLNIKPGDEVIVPSFTFVSTVNAFVLRGARPVFIDIKPDTLNLDESQLERLITPRTRAIVVVHYAGVGCEMEAIIEIARRRGIVVVEDNAHGLFGKYKGKNLGTFGALATLSFHETKNISCGEGGALIINDPQYVDRAEIIRQKGTNRSHFFRGQIDKYTWVDVGSSYGPSDILAAFLYSQLEARQMIQARRQKIWNYYHEHLLDWCKRYSVQMPSVPDYCDQSYHMYYLLLNSPAEREGLMAHLDSRKIKAVFHYQPLHLSRMGRLFGGSEGDCPVTEGLCDQLLRLPFYNDLAEADQAVIVSEIETFSPG